MTDTHHWHRLQEEALRLGLAPNLAESRDNIIETIIHALNQPTPQRQLGLRKRIIEILEDAKGPVTTMQLRESTGAVASSLYSTLHHLQKSGKIVRVGRGSYWDREVDA